MHAGSGMKFGAVESFFQGTKLINLQENANLDILVCIAI